MLTNFLRRLLAKRSSASDTLKDRSVLKCVRNEYNNARNAGHEPELIRVGIGIQQAMMSWRISCGQLITAPLYFKAAELELDGSLHPFEFVIGDAHYVAD